MAQFLQWNVFSLFNSVWEAACGVCVGFFLLFFLWKLIWGWERDVILPAAVCLLCKQWRCCLSVCLWDSGCFSYTQYLCPVALQLTFIFSFRCEQKPQNFWFQEFAQKCMIWSRYIISYNQVSAGSQGPDLLFLQLALGFILFLDIASAIFGEFMSPSYYLDFAIPWRNVFANYADCKQTDESNRAMQMCFFQKLFQWFILKCRKKQN